MSSEVSWKQEHKLIDLEEKSTHYRVFTINHKKTNWLPLSAVHGYSSGMKVSLTHLSTVWLVVSIFVRDSLQLDEG